jgi:hypothetical protein
VEQSIEACHNQIDDSLAREQRIYRSVILGRSSASGASVAEVRYDRLGKAWYKKTLGESSTNWILVEQSQPTTPQMITDDAMDAIMEIDSIPANLGGITFPRPSYFTTKRVLTSEMVPFLTSSMRSLHCRTAIVCDVARQSVGLTSEQGNEPKIVTVNVPGCVPLEWQSLPACHFAESQDQIAAADIERFCESVGNQMIQREKEIAKALVEYDAAYRSLLQFTGILDQFLEEFRWTITGGIRQAASMMGWLQGLPCFLASCEEYPTNLPTLEDYLANPSLLPPVDEDEEEDTDDPPPFRP